MRRRRGAVDWFLTPRQSAVADAMWAALVDVGTGGCPVSVKALLDGQEVILLGMSLGEPMGGYRALAPLVVVIDQALLARLTTEQSERDT